MKQGNQKSFLRNAIILSVALALVCVFMPQWGIAQMLVVVLLALLAGFQWVLYFFIK